MKSDLRLPALFLFVFFLCLLLPPGRAGAFCFEEASDLYHMPAELLKAMARVESGLKADAININKDGSYDYGLMQINSRWRSLLGEKAWDRLDEPCFNLKVGAWILSGCIERYGRVWESVGCYNTKERKKRSSYVRKVRKALTKIRTEQ